MAEQDTQTPSGGQPPQAAPASSAFGASLLILGGIGLLTGLGFFAFALHLTAMILAGLGVAGIGFGLTGRFGPVWSAIGGAGVALAGMGLLIYGLGLFEKTPDSIHWPTAPATVIRSNAEVFTTTERVGKDENIIHYDIAVIEYTYAVGGKHYSSNRIALAEPKRGDAPRLLKNFPIYKQTHAYYNPKKPEEAVLEPGERKGGILQTLIGALMIVLGVWTAIRKFQRFLETLS